MKDYLGREIKVGDWVLVSKHQKTSVELFDGHVIAFSEKSFTVATHRINRVVYASYNTIILNGQVDAR